MKDVKKVVKYRVSNGQHAKKSSSRVPTVQPGILWKENIYYFAYISIWAWKTGSL